MDSLASAQNGGMNVASSTEGLLTEKTNPSSVFIILGIFLFSTFIISQYYFSTL